MKKRLYTVLTVLVIAAMLFSFVSCGKEEAAATSTPAASTTTTTAKAADIKARTFKIGHVRPDGTSTDVDVKNFTKAVGDATGGKFTFEIYSNSQLGNYSVVQERIGVGDIEMQLAPLATNVSKGLGIVSAPYICASWDEVPVVFARDGELMAYVNSLVAKENIKLLAAYPKYFGGIILSKPAPAPTDPYVNQGVKIRVPGIKSYEKTAESLGFIATPIAFSEAFTSIQTGIVDGAIGSGAEGYYSSFRDVAKYYLPNNDHFEMWFLMIGTDTWNKLSAEEKQIMQDAADMMEKERYAVAEAEQKEFEGKLKANGTEIIEFSKDDLKKIAEKVKKEVWPVIKGDFGEAGEKFL
jgi:TRAP-type C4-dicarboxylate transport system substrate-binding protein